MKVTSEVDQQEYGENYRVHVWEQYKLYVQMADKISARRQSANNFFLSINTALIAILTFLRSNTDANKAFLAVVAAISGFILCFAWFRLIKSYKSLNGAKFKVIHEIEKKLPLVLYSAEWKAVERGNNPKLHNPLTKIEAYVPWMFFLLYVVVTVAFLI
jgi:hypothetical protein